MKQEALDMNEAGASHPLLLAWLRYRQWRAEVRAIRHLNEIDDYLLDDVGIQRDDIKRVVRGDTKGERDAAIASGAMASPHSSARLVA